MKGSTDTWTPHPALQSSQDRIRAGEAIGQESGMSTGSQDMIHMINYCCPLPLQVHPNIRTKRPGVSTCHDFTVFFNSVMLL